MKQENQTASELTVESAIANLRQKEDLGLRYYAAWWLGRFRVQDTAAVAALLEALEDEEDRAPDGGYPLRRNAARALGKIGDTKAVEPLISCLSFEDYYVREAAAQALETIGDERAINPLMQLLAGGVEAATTVPGKPYLVQPYEAVIEALGTLQAKSAITEIKPFLEHPLAKIKSAAARALYQLTNNDMYGEMLVETLRNQELQIRRSALIDLGASGYLKGAEAIANTYAENSLKLIALKNLVEPELEKSSQPSKRCMEIIKIMDELL